MGIPMQDQKISSNTLNQQAISFKQNLQCSLQALLVQLTHD